MMYNSLPEFERNIERSIDAGNLDEALQTIEDLVSEVIQDSASIARVFGSARLDSLCQRIGLEIAKRHGATNAASGNNKSDRVVIVATELYNTGGHTAVIEQIIKAQPEKEFFILLTDLFARLDISILQSRFDGICVEPAPLSFSLSAKVDWLQGKLREIAPGRAFLFNHHQDAVAIAAAQPNLAGQFVFYHHCDHHLCLGLFLSHALHVDPHSMGFFNCREALGIQNTYWPLVTTDLGGRPVHAPFLTEGQLRTCSSGSPGKFEQPYLYPYEEVIPTLLGITKGVHIHIGGLSDGYLQKIRRSLEMRDIDPSRFVVVPWVKSLWAAMIQNRVDLYLTSFPLGGGLAGIEVMGSGTPLAVHRSYRSRFHGGADLVYPEALSWKEPGELYEYVQRLTAETLAAQSVYARRHYEQYHTPDRLRSVIGIIECNHFLTPPPLRPYFPESLQIYLDQIYNHNPNLIQAVAERDGQIARLNEVVAERDGQIARLNEVVAERDGQIARLNEVVAERDGQIINIIAERDRIVHSRSWRLTKPLRDFRFHLLNRLYHFIRCIVSGMARRIWLNVPLSARRKQVLKYKLFSRLPYIFRWSTAYRSWEALNAPSDEMNGLSIDKTSQPVFEPSPGAYVPLLHALPPKSVPVRLIAFYLPQFHAIPENNLWWGDGFTEWTNIKPAQPQFEGHYQPHIPDELGYYNLLDPAIQRRQIELAKLYGVGGFCFYSYWFGGKLLLEKPLENYLNDRNLDFPFCLCWANENWSRRWDGLDSEILIAQKHSPEDDLGFIAYAAKYMRDDRYIRIDGRPLFLVYRPSLLPSAKETAKRWRDWCRQNGIGDIFLAYTQSFDTGNPSKYGFDAAVEFPPNNSSPRNITGKVKALSERFGCTVYDWQVFVERSRNYQKPNYKLFRGVNPSWDNTARRKNRGTVFLNSSPGGYHEWLSNAVAETCFRISNPDERLIFVNAWNEWAEGAHLEPDQRFGYAYLDATRKALLGEEMTAPKRVIVVSHDAHPHGAQFLALGMVRSLTQDLHLEVEVVLLDGGRLKTDFSSLAPVHDLSDVPLESVAAGNLARALAQRGFTRAIVNTTASGGVIPLFSEAGIESICLVHELPGVIHRHRLENQVKQIARSAKAVVFPAQIVADGFSQFALIDREKQFIRPQGLYRRNRWRLEKQAARVKLRKQLGLHAETKIVLAVGYADHRKGVDLFVTCAIHILAKRTDVDFIWVGHWDQEMQRKIEAELDRSQYKNRIHFVGYDSDTALFHAASDVYALTSREDPFPNVVLESFDAGVPVVAFASSGGGACLVEEVGGIVVPMIDTAAFSAAICQLLDAPELSSRLGDAAQNHVDQYFAFRPYLFDLCDMLGMKLPRISVIVPNYNYARYIEERLASICNQSIPIFELIILDDASTDDSFQRISRWLSVTHTDARIIVNRTNSGNVFVQWRQGISLASGDYIWIAEADDLSDPDFLEAVLPPLISGDAVLSYCESQQINSDGVVLAKNYQAYLSAVSKERWKSAFIASGIQENKTSLAVINTIPNVSAVVFKRDAISAVFTKHFDEIASFQKAGDWVVYFRTLFLGNIAFTPRAANRHRRHEGSVIGGSGRQGLLQEIIKIQQTIASEIGISIDVQQKAMVFRRTLQE
ncbi:MAG: glycoside hydrolase family 99-like domain-containing protein [Candidatus Manganitrophus sp.]|nr:MAG: glycoside hydrolase family 99-like domain-containing protein [Candidatus Manganitrophus sp.]